MFYNIFLIVEESNRDTLYHELNIRRLKLTLIPKVVMTKTCLICPHMFASRVQAQRSLGSRLGPHVVHLETQSE